MATVLAALMISGGGLMAMAAPRPVAVSAAADEVSSQDSGFLKEAVGNNYTAIQEGKIMLMHSHDVKLKKIAQEIVDTHTKLQTELQGQAKAGSVDVPTGAGAECTQMCMKLSHMRGHELDKQFVTSMITFHEMELKNFKNEAENGKSMPTLKLAQNMVPEIQQHLDDLQGIQKSGK